MPDLSPNILALLKNPSPPPLRALVGFDGYVDLLYKVIRQRSSTGKIPYVDIPEFGKDIMSRAGRSGGFELSKISARAGGNAPLMAAAMAALEVKVSCLGTLGAPQTDPVFEALSKSCRLFSAGAPAFTVALEFDDGKLMLGDTESFESLDWARLVQTLGLGKISALVAEADLLALVNWANMPLATNLWKGLLEEVLEKNGPSAKAKRIFFDLADLTRCGSEETKDLVALLGRFRAHGQVVLGLNENEAWQLAEKLGLKIDPKDSLENLGQELMGLLKVDCLVVHPRERAIVFQDGKSASVAGRLVEKPLLSTGGGDNFNAGFCVGLLHGLEPKDAATLAVQVSSLYVAQGRSPSRAEILAKA